MKPKSTLPFVLLVTLIALVTSAHGAGTVHFSESLSDKLVSIRDPDSGETFSDVRRTLTLNLSGTFGGDEIATTPLDDSSEVSLSLGELEFSSTLGEADVLTENQATYIFYAENDNGDSLEAGRLKLSRSGATLSVALNLRNMGSSAIVESYASDPESLGKIAGELRFNLRIGSIVLDRLVVFSGSQSLVHKRTGGESGEEWDLYSVSVAGGLDTKKPSLSILSPAKGARFASETCVIRGKANDDDAVESIDLYLNGEYVNSASDYDEDTGLWSIETTLQPGMNRLAISCSDRSGNVVQAEVMAQYFLTAPIAISARGAGSVVGVTNGQLLELGKNYKMTAKAEPNHLFRAWRVQGVSVTDNPLEVTMIPGLTMEAEFVTNRIAEIQGTYSGLFAPEDSHLDQPQQLDPSSLQGTNCGMIVVTLSGKGLTTGKLLRGGKSLSFSGVCNADGAAEIQVTSVGVLALQFLNDGGEARIEGVLHQGGTPLKLLAFRGSTDAANQRAGNYTFALPGASAEAAALIPSGDGAGKFSLTGKGGLKLAGTLGDGTPIALGAAVDAHGRWPLYSSLAGGKSFVIGWGTVTEQVEAGSRLVWAKAPTPKDRVYPKGFTTTMPWLSSEYVVTNRNQNALGWSRGVILLDGGNLSATVSNRLEVVNNNVNLLDGNLQKVTMSINAATGDFKGSFVHPATRKPVTFSGVILFRAPELNSAFGWFQGPTESGYVEIVAESGFAAW